MLRMLKDIRPDNPTIALRFCLDPADRAKIAESKVTDIYVLLIVVYENDRGEDRQLIPLNQLRAYVGFRYPGRHTVLAQVVWPQGSVAQMEMFLMEKSRRRSYNTDVLDYGTATLRQVLPGVKSESRTIAGDEFEIEVPKEYFAKEPPEWLKRWANLWHQYQPVDQCELRRRLFLAFTLKWIPVFLFLFVRTCAALVLTVAGLFLGIRRLRPGVIVHPWTTDVLEDMWIRFDPDPDSNSTHHGMHSWIIEDAKGRFRFKTILVSPPFLLICWSGWSYIAQALQTISSRRVLVVVFAVVGYLTYKALDYYSTKLTARRNDPAYLAELEAEAQRQREELLRLLACPTASEAAGAVSLSAIPFRRRALKLYYFEAKRAVCKQFAG